MGYHTKMRQPLRLAFPAVNESGGGSRMDNVESLNRLDRDCVSELLKFGKAHFGTAWKPVQVYEEDLGGDAQQLQLFLPWAAYMYEIDGHTAASRYTELHGKEFSVET